MITLPKEVTVRINVRIKATRPIKFVRPNPLPPISIKPKNFLGTPTIKKWAKAIIANQIPNSPLQHPGIINKVEHFSVFLNFDIGPIIRTMNKRITETLLNDFDHVRLSANRKINTRRIDNVPTIEC